MQALQLLMPVPAGAVLLLALWRRCWAGIWVLLWLLVPAATAAAAA
jgi:hypothetical protein